MSYNYYYNGNVTNINSIVKGFVSNLTNFQQKFQNSGSVSTTNDLGIDLTKNTAYTSWPYCSSFGYNYLGSDVSTFCIANYVDNTAITKTNIPVWCTHIRVVMVSSGGTGYIYNNQTHIDVIGVNNQDYDGYSHSHSHDASHKSQQFQTTYSASIINQQQAPGYDRTFQGYITQTHVVTSATPSNTPGAGSFTLVDIKTANLQTLQIGSNVININTYGIQLSNGTSATGGATGVNGTNGSVTLQGVTAQGANYTVSNLFTGKQYSSGTSGINGILVFDSAATRTDGNQGQTGFYRIYYLTT